MRNPQVFVQKLLLQADIRLNGERPWDLKIHDERTFVRSLAHGSLGFGESYMDGWWDCDALDVLLTKIFEAHLDQKIQPWRALIPAVMAKILNKQNQSKAFEIGHAHYDIGNDFYEKMLDHRMVYTCGYWKPLSDMTNRDTLDQAQERKLDLVCRKIGLKPGMRVLDIGCGWGSFAIFAAEKYGVEVVGVTVSEQQVVLAKKKCAGLPIEIRLQDYREVTGLFDRVVSLGMFEHVGVKNYRTYMDVVYRLLPEHGLCLLHTIGGNHSVFSTDPWIEKYIFPNSMLPSVGQIGRAIEWLFVMEDWHNFGAHYDRTLLTWYQNIEHAWTELEARYDERFRRMWRFYLLSSAATFRSRRNQLWQIVLSKDGLPGGYDRVFK